MLLRRGGGRMRAEYLPMRRTSPPFRFRCEGAPVTCSRRRTWKRGREKRRLSRRQKFREFAGGEGVHISCMDRTCHEELFPRSLTLIYGGEEGVTLSEMFPPFPPSFPLSAIPNTGKKRSFLTAPQKKVSTSSSRCWGNNLPRFPANRSEGKKCRKGPFPN